MQILCIGLNHLTASVALRERLAFGDEAIKAALARHGCGASGPQGISEMVILSTCNRVELYALSSEEQPGLALDALVAFLSETRRVPVDEFRPHLYNYTGEAAVEHLLQVAAGLDSLVLGEPQVLGQVVQAFELARGQGAAGPVLSRLFQSAIFAGRRVRAETSIACNPTSIASMAVRLASQSLPHLENAQVAVLGAGEMARLAGEALRKRGVTRFLVINRTLARASLLAADWKAQAVTFEALPEALAQADILIASTSAPHTLIDSGMLARQLPARDGRPLVIVDLAVPRDVDPQVADLPGVSLYDLDTLQAFLDQALVERATQVPGAQAILTDEKAAFLDYWSTLDMLPLIGALHRQAEAIRQTELQKTLRRLPDLSPEDQLRVEALSRALVKQLLHGPISRLRAEAGCTGQAEFTSITRALFNLDES
jgi:glutamyl-tRNA reductase